MKCNRCGFVTGQQGLVCWLCLKPICAYCWERHGCCEHTPDEAAAALAASAEPKEQAP